MSGRTKYRSRGEPARNVAVTEAIGEWLATSEQPKLVLYASPGAITPPEAVAWMAENFNNHPDPLHRQRCPLSAGGRAGGYRPQPVRLAARRRESRRGRATRLGRAWSRTRHCRSSQVRMGYEPSYAGDDAIMDYRRKLQIEPGSKVRLGEIDPDYRGDGLSKDQALLETDRLLDEIRALQYLLLRRTKPCPADRPARHRRRRQGWRLPACHQGDEPPRVLGVRLQTAQHLGAVARLSLAHSFTRAPAMGEVAVFNRSHYEDVLIVRVHNLVAGRRLAPSLRSDQRFRAIC